MRWHPTPNCNARCRQLALDLYEYGDVVSDFGGSVAVARAGGRAAVDAVRRGIGSGHSFEPDTPVLMADGTTKPIKDVKIGDYVLATDPKTGHTEVKPVVAVHLNLDISLTDIAIVDADGTVTSCALLPNIDSGAPLGKSGSTHRS